MEASLFPQQSSKESNSQANDLSHKDNKPFFNINTKAPQTHSKSIENFEFLTILGRGSFGKVCLALDVESKNEELYAIKIVSKQTIRTNSELRAIVQERQILELVTGKSFLPTLHWAFEDKKSFYFVMDFLQKGDLFTMISDNPYPIPRYAATTIAAELLLAVEHLHSLQIVHGDLKVENVMFDVEGHVVLIDFGLSKKLEPGETKKAFSGTLDYMAPELISTGTYTKAVDFWAYGLIYYEIFTSETFFTSRNFKNANAFSKYLQHCKLRFNHKSLNTADKKLCKSLVAKKVEKRVNDWNVVKCMLAFEGINWEEIKMKNKRIDIPGYGDMSRKDCSKFEFSNETSEFNSVSELTESGRLEFEKLVNFYYE